MSDELATRLGRYLLHHAQQPGGVSISISKSERRENDWSAMSLFGREAEDSPMVGGSGIGAGETLDEAVVMLLEEARY